MIWNNSLLITLCMLFTSSNVDSNYCKNGGTDLAAWCISHCDIIQNLPSLVAGYWIMKYTHFMYSGTCIWYSWKKWGVIPLNIENVIIMIMTCLSIQFNVSPTQMQNIFMYWQKIKLCTILSFQIFCSGENIT